MGSNVIDFRAKATSSQIPNAPEAEAALLGSILLRPVALEQILGRVQPGDFYRTPNRLIFESIIALQKRSSDIDTVTLGDYLEGQGQLETVGGYEYLVELSEVVPTSGNIQSYANVVIDKSLLRSYIEIHWEGIDEGYRANRPAMEIIEESEQKVFALSQRQTSDAVIDAETAVMGSLAAIDKAMRNFENGIVINGLGCGFADIEKNFGGWENGDLVILAARPSMGKTAFALNVAEHVAVDQKKGVLIFTQEMSHEICCMRMLASRAGVDLSKLRVGDIDVPGYKALQNAGADIYSSPLFIDDTPGLTISQMRGACRRMKRKHDIKLVIIDYIQIMTPRDLKVIREQQVAELSRGLKGIAREIDTPILALSQLNRGVEIRDDKRPRMSDIRESGAIEQDADHVTFLYREAYYLEKEEPLEEQFENIHDYNQAHFVWSEKMDKARGKVRFIEAKNRNGRTGEVDLSFTDFCARFADLSKRMES